jgi:hypothetical protein
MTMAEALVAKLTAAAAVAALVGPRITPQVNTSNDFPQIVYRVSRGKITGVNLTLGDIEPFTLTVTSAATSYTAAGELASLVRAALDEQTEGWGEAFVRSSIILDEQEDDDRDTETPNRIYYSVTQTYQVWAYLGE